MQDDPALVEALERVGIACSLVASLRDALRGPFAEERRLLVPLDDHRGGTRDVVRSPYRFYDGGREQPGPEGQHGR